VPASAAGVLCFYAQLGLLSCSLPQLSVLCCFICDSLVGNSEQQHCFPLLIDLLLLEPVWSVLIATGQQQYMIQSCPDLSMD